MLKKIICHGPNYITLFFPNHAIWYPAIPYLQIKNQSEMILGENIAFRASFTCDRILHHNIKNIVDLWPKNKENTIHLKIQSYLCKIQCIRMFNAWHYHIEVGSQMTTVSSLIHWYKTEDKHKNLPFQTATMTHMVRDCIIIFEQT